MSEDDENLDEDTSYWNERANIEESQDLLSLIESGFDTNYYNTFTWVQHAACRFNSMDKSSATELLAALKDVELKSYDSGYSFYDCRPSFDFESMDNLNNEWSRLRGGGSIDSLEERLSTYVPIDPALTPVERFLDDVRVGGYPTPEIIYSVAKSFELYFLAAGRLSLEEIFFGREKKRSGNYAARRLKQSLYMYYHEERLREVQFDNCCSLKESIRNFLAQMAEDESFRFIDEDTFEKGYRRWLKSSNYRQDGQ